MTNARALRSHGTGGTVRMALLLGALGVVFGDIGTSPIYTLQTVFNPDDPHIVPLTTDNVYGVVSLVVWSITLIVTVTYVLLALRLDNNGEGGIMALITLIRRHKPTTRLVAVLAAIGLFGAALFLGDSMITPAISVLSAIEGLNVVNPDLHSAVVPITAAIIAVLFLVQRFGTGLVGQLFGPVMVLWFGTIAALGIGGIIGHPSILWALSPTHAFRFITEQPGVAFFALAAVVLAVTGAEALYADLGHFGRRPIRRAWLFITFPACALSYLGQGGLILSDNTTVSAPFFLLAPGWALIPLVVLAAAATIIASQAVITGAFSVAAQAGRLGYLPRARILHTSTRTEGQIYVPWINWVLLFSVLTLVFTFRSSAALAYAFGMAVTGTITITTLLFFTVARQRWRSPRWLLILGAAPLLAVDLTFLAANLTKLTHGAWLPLAIALTAFTVMMTWQRGQKMLGKRRARFEGSLQAFVEHLDAHPEAVLATVPGTAIFLNRRESTTPLALRQNVEHNRVRHEHMMIVTVVTKPVPYVLADARAVVDPLGRIGDGITHITLRFGYAEVQDVPTALAALDPAVTEGPLDLDRATYFLSLIELRVVPRVRAAAARTRLPGAEAPDATGHDDPHPPRMARWRKRLFVATARFAANPADAFALPRDRVVVLGSQVEV